MDYKNFSKDTLFDLNIHELRRLGASVGVKSPSNQSKDTLVGNIYSIITGSQEPYKQKDRRGRPPKGDISPINLEMLELRQNEHPMGLGMVATQMPQYNNYCFMCPENANAKRGTVVVRETGMFIAKYPFVVSVDDAMVPKDVALDFNLRQFDVVEFLYVDDNAYIKQVGKILTVNGKEVSPEEVVFNRLEADGKGEEVNVTFNGEKIIFNRGSKVLIRRDQPVTDIKTALDLAESIAKTGDVVIKLLIDKKDALKGDAFTFEALVTDMSSVVVSAANAAMLKAKALVGVGKSVVIIIDDFCSLNAAFSKIYGAEAETFVKRCLFSADHFDNGASLTIFGLTSNKYCDKYAGYFDKTI